MKRLHIACIALFGALLVAPFFQMMHPLVDEVRLVGFLENPGHEKLNTRNWFRGSFQRAADRWWNSSLGFRGHAIRTDSQINYSLFKESGVSTLDLPIPGRGGMIHSAVYVDAFNRTVEGPVARNPGDFASELRRVQDVVKAHGACFFVLITPSKAETYPASVPPRHCSPSRTTRLSAYEELLPALATQGVHVVDMAAQFRQLAPTSSIPLFPPGGIHWNQYGVYLAHKAIVSELSRQSGRQPADMTCDRIMTHQVTPSSVYTETDIQDMLNLWTIDKSPVPLPRLRLSPREGWKPRVMIVGDSFAHTLLTLWNAGSAIESADWYYYFSTVWHFPSAAKSSVDRSTLDLAGEFSEHDVVILEMNEILLESRGWGFVETALKQLSRSNEH